MENVRLNHPIRQMFIAVAGFIFAIMFIESAPLKNWAEALRPGMLRTVAVPVTAAIDRSLGPLGIDRLRDRALDESARLGWADDAGRLARSTRPASPRSPASSAAPLAAVQSATGAAPVATPTRLVHAIAPLVPLAPAVPRATALAPLPPVEPGKPRVVALAGDSMMAVGLSATLMRQAVGDKNLRLVKAFRSGTGLARPDFFNWMDEYPAMLGAETPQVVIVAIGANDGQGFIVDGKVQDFGGDDWRTTYQSRVADYLEMVESTGARVVWVGLPPMRSSAFNDKIAVINRIAYSIVSQDPRATWWNSTPFVADESGAFREFALLSNGKTVRMRAEDGIHFSDEGADLMASVLMKWLDPPLEAAGNGPAPRRPVSGRTAVAPVTLAANP